MAVSFKKQYYSQSDYLKDVATQSHLFSQNTYNQFLQEDAFKAKDYLSTIALSSKNTSDTFNFNDYKLLDADDQMTYLYTENLLDRSETATDEETGEKYNVYDRNKEYLNQQIELKIDEQTYNNLNFLERTIHTIGGILGTIFNEAILGTLEGLIDVFSAGLGFTDFAAQDITGYSRNRETLERYKRQYTYLDKGTVGTLIDDVITGVSQMAPAFIPYAGPALYWSSSAGKIAEETIKSNPDIDYGTLLGYTAGSTVLSVGIEKISKIFGGSAVDKVLLRSTTSKAGSTITRFATETGTEALEESIDQFLNSCLYTAMVDPNAPVASIDEVLYAGLIGGIIGGGFNVGRIATTEKGVLLDNGQLVSKKQAESLGLQGKELGKAQTLNIKETLSRLNQLNSRDAVGDLRTKYHNESLEQIQKNHSQEYQKAVAKNEKNMEKTAKVGLGLAKILEVAGVEKFVKATEFANYTLEQKQKYINNYTQYNLRNAIGISAVEKEYAEKFKGSTLTINKTPPMIGRKIRDAIKASYGIDVYFGKLGFSDGLKKNNALTLNEKTIVIDEDVLSTQSVDTIINKYLKEELVHTLQYKSGIMTKDTVVDLFKTYNELSGIDNKKEPNIKNLRSYSEQQAKAMCEMLLFDEIMISRMMPRHTDVFHKISNWLHRLKDNIKTRKTRKDKLKYNLLLKTINKQKEANKEFSGEDKILGSYNQESFFDYLERFLKTKSSKITFVGKTNDEKADILRQNFGCTRRFSLLITDDEVNIANIIDSVVNDNIFVKQNDSFHNFILKWLFPTNIKFRKIQDIRSFETTLKKAILLKNKGLLPTEKQTTEEINSLFDKNNFNQKDLEEITINISSIDEFRLRSAKNDAVLNDFGFTETEIDDTLRFLETETMTRFRSTRSDMKIDTDTDVDDKKYGNVFFNDKYMGSVQPEHEKEASFIKKYNKPEEAVVEFNQYINKLKNDDSVEYFEIATALRTDDNLIERNPNHIKHRIIEVYGKKRGEIVWKAIKKLRPMRRSSLNTIIKDALNTAKESKITDEKIEEISKNFGNKEIRNSLGASTVFEYRNYLYQKLGIKNRETAPPIDVIVSDMKKELENVEEDESETKSKNSLRGKDIYHSTLTDKEIKKFKSSEGLVWFSEKKEETHQYGGNTYSAKVNSDKVFDDTVSEETLLEILDEAFKSGLNEIRFKISNDPPKITTIAYKEGNILIDGVAKKGNLKDFIFINGRLPEGIASAEGVAQRIRDKGYDYGLAIEDNLKEKTVFVVNPDVITDVKLIEKREFKPQQDLSKKQEEKPIKKEVAETKKEEPATKQKISTAPKSNSKTTQKKQTAKVADKNKQDKNQISMFDKQESTKPTELEKYKSAKQIAMFDGVKNEKELKKIKKRIETSLDSWRKVKEKYPKNIKKQKEADRNINKLEKQLKQINSGVIPFKIQDAATTKNDTKEFITSQARESSREIDTILDSRNINPNLKKILNTDYSEMGFSDVQFVEEGVNEQQNIIHIQEFNEKNSKLLDRLEENEIVEMLNQISTLPWNTTDLNKQRIEMSNRFLFALYVMQRKYKYTKETRDLAEKYLRIEASTSGTILGVWSSLAERADPINKLKENFEDAFGIDLKIDEQLEKDYKKAIHDRDFAKMKDCEEKLIITISQQLPDDRYNMFKGKDYQDKIARFKRFVGKMSSFRYFAMLTNPSTHIQNVISNTSIKLLNDASSALMHQIEKNFDFEKYDQFKYEIKGKPDPRIINFVESQYGDKIDRICKQGKYDRSDFDDLFSEALLENQYKTKWLQKWSDMVFDALSSMDRKFTRPALVKMMAKMIQANKMISDEVLGFYDLLWKHNITNVRKVDGKTLGRIVVDGETFDFGVYISDGVVKKQSDSGDLDINITHNITNKNKEEIDKILNKIKKTITTLSPSLVVATQKDFINEQKLEMMLQNATSRVMLQYLRRDNAFTKWWTNMEDKHWILKIMMSAILPFPRVVSNMTIQLFQYTPIQLVRGLYRMFMNSKKGSWYSKKKKKYLPIDQVMTDDSFYLANMSEMVAKGTIGTTLMLFGFILSAIGLIGLDEDDEYGGVVVKLGNFKIQLKSFAPALSPMLIGATFAHAEEYPDFFGRLKMTVNDLTMLGTFDSMFSYGQDLYTVPQNAMSNYFVQFVPAILRNFNKIYSSEKQKDYSNWFTKTITRILDGIPAFREILPDKINPYTGEPVYAYGNWFLAAINMVNPVRVSVNVESDLSREADRLSATTTGLEGRFTYNGEVYVIPNNKIESYQRYRANYLKWLYAEYLDGERITVENEDGERVDLLYSEMTDKQKANVIKSMYVKATEMSKIKYWTDLGNTYVCTDSKLFAEYSQEFKNVVYRPNWKRSKFLEG